MFRRFCLALACSAPLTATAAETAPGLCGEYWNSDVEMSLLDAVDLSESRIADAFFVSESLNYPGPEGGAGTDKPVVNDRTKLYRYLDVDPETLGAHAYDWLATSVFRFSGYLELSAGTHEFTIAADDGFALAVNGTVLAYDGAPGLGMTAISYEAAGGPVEVALLYFENAVQTGIEFLVDGIAAGLPSTVHVTTVEAPVGTGGGSPFSSLRVSVVPAPPAAPLLAAAIVAFGLLRRGPRARRRRAG